MTMGNYSRYEFSIKRIILGFIMGLIAEIFFIYYILSEYIHVLPTWTSDGADFSRGIVPFAFIYGIYAISISLRRLLHRGPAVVVDATGIWVWPWNGKRKMAWSEIVDARFEDWGRRLNPWKTKKIGYIVLRSQSGGKIRIGSHEFRRMDWEEIYEHTRAAIPPAVESALPPLHEQESES